MVRCYTSISDGVIIYYHIRFRAKDKGDGKLQITVVSCSVSFRDVEKKREIVKKKLIKVYFHYFLQHKDLRDADAAGVGFGNKSDPYVRVW